MMAGLNEIELLDLALTELKSMLMCLDTMYDNLKNKFILFTSGQLAYLGYIYSSTAVNESSDQIKRLFIPSDLSSQIFYVFGIVLAILSLSYLFQGFLPSRWTVPPHSKDLKKLKFKNKLEMMLYLRDEYYEAVQHNGTVYESKNSMYSKGLVCLVIGNVILFVIRFFGSIQIGV